MVNLVHVSKTTGIECTALMTLNDAHAYARDFLLGKKHDVNISSYEAYDIVSTSAFLMGNDFFIIDKTGTNINIEAPMSNIDSNIHLEITPIDAYNAAIEGEIITSECVDDKPAAIGFSIGAASTDETVEIEVINLSNENNLVPLFTKTINISETAAVEKDQ